MQPPNGNVVPFRELGRIRTEAWKSVVWRILEISQATELIGGMKKGMDQVISLPAAMSTSSNQLVHRRLLLSSIYRSSACRLADACNAVVLDLLRSLLATKSLYASHLSVFFHIDFGPYDPEPLRRRRGGTFGHFLSLPVLL